MKLEPIDTSTTAGKAHVMELASMGRDLVARDKAGNIERWVAGGWLPLALGSDEWDWPNMIYAIAAQPVGPDEVWAVVREGSKYVPCYDNKADADAYSCDPPGTVVRYRRVEE